MVVPFPEKLVHFLKSSSPSPLLDFRSKTSHILAQIGNNGSKSMNTAACFEMMHSTTAAFAKLVAEIDYPVSRWGGAATHEYLVYTSTLLGMLNSITSALSHLTMIEISVIVHDRTFADDSNLKKIGRSSVGGEIKYRGIEMRRSSRHEESVIVEALMELKKIGVLALGLVLSSLEMRVFDLESRFCREIRGVGGECDEGVSELKYVIMGIYKETNSLFSEVLAARNKVLDNIRFTRWKCGN